MITARQMMVYTYSSKVSFAGIDSTSTSKVWIGVSDNLPHKAIVDGEALGVKSTTTQIISYDPSIKIEAPM